MALTPEQFRVMQERVMRNSSGVKKTPVSLPLSPPVQPQDPATILFVQPKGFFAREFIYHGMPIGKPRMTQRDKFLKRPCVQRYWQFKDALKVVAGDLPVRPDMLIVTAWVPMPESWSQKKQDEHNSQPCRQKPDWDNIAKAVADALFDEDSCLWVGVTAKYWCPSGQERLIVKVLYAKSS